MTVRSFALLLCSASLVAGALAGCSAKQTAPTSLPPARVEVAKVEVRDNIDYEDFTGRIDALESVDVRALATGYLKKVNFVAGTEVKAGQLLFEIDPESYQADLQTAQAAIATGRARLKDLNSQLARGRRLVVDRAMSREDFDKVVADQASTEADLLKAQAQVTVAEKNLGYTKVTAPIDGRISREKLTPGNLVNGSPSNSVLLTNIVRIDKVYAYFDIDERTVLRVQALIRKGKAKPVAQRPDVYVATQIEKGFFDESGKPRHAGKIDFVENALDSGTGTLQVRGIFDNPDRVLTKGLFVRVRVPIGEARPALLVDERALGTDQGQRFLYAVNDKSEVEYRPVTLGSLRDGLRALEPETEPGKGVRAGEWVIVNGLQRVRPGVTVEAKRVPMPGLAALDKMRAAREKSAPSKKQGE